MDVNLTYSLILVATGLVAGVINTLAGGGSALTLPALMIMGMPPEVANATNRVGIFLQCLTGVVGFKKNDKLPQQDLLPILIPTLIGGLFGGLLAAYAPSSLLKPMLLGAMVCMALMILIKPSAIITEVGTQAYLVKERPSSWVGLGLAGFYGGFVQAGVGFILIAALAGTLRYDLVRANALKLLCSLCFTAVALGIFIYEGQVMWVPGLILASGFIVGAHIAVKFAITAKPHALKWILFIMTLVACFAALFF